MKHNDGHPTVIGTRRIHFLANVLEYPFFYATAPAITGLLAWLQFVLGWTSEPNRPIVFVLGTVALGLAPIIPIVARTIRFTVLQREIKQGLKELPLSSETFILGAGGGSFKAIGMILKAWEEEHPKEPPPKCLCISMQIERDEIRFFPELDTFRSIVKNPMLIVLAQIGTGSTAKALRRWAGSIEGFKSIDIFSMIISPSAADSREWNGAFTLCISNRKSSKRSVLPWVSTRDEF